MQLQQQINQWHENNEFQRIVDAIEALPSHEQTPALLSELGRAYNNLYFQSEGDAGKEYLIKALRILQPLEMELGENPKWHFRIGYSYYYLDQEANALAHFKKYLDYDPQDEDTLELVQRCQRILSTPPVQGKDFQSRAQMAWGHFEREEATLRQMVLQTQENQGDPDDLMAKVQQILAPVFEDPACMIGFNGEKFELILSPSDFQPDLFPILCFLQKAPTHLLAQWNFVCGQPRWPEDEVVPLPDGTPLRWPEVQIWVHPVDEEATATADAPPPRYWAIHCWHEALAAFAREDADAAMTLAQVLVTQAVGEAVAMTALDDVQVLAAPENAPSMSLADLQNYLLQACPELEKLDLQILQQRYSSYEIAPERRAPSEKVAGHERNDVVEGFSSSSHFVKAFLTQADEIMAHFQNMGATPGFFFYPRTENAPTQAQLQNELKAILGENNITFIGTATGSHFDYVDCIYWGDAQTFSTLRQKISESALNDTLHYLGFRVFRSDALPLMVYQGKFHSTSDAKKEKNHFSDKNL